MTSSDDRLRQAADELYAAPLTEFVATLKLLADSADDRHLAAVIRKLPKPAAAAAAVNLFARSNPDDIARLAIIGDRLRTAEADGDAAALRELSSERRRAVAEVTSLAVKSTAASPSTRTAVEATFQAAVIDPAATAAVASGLLVKALTPGGDLEDATALHEAAPARGAPQPKTSGGQAARKTVATRKALEAAEQAKADADKAAAALTEAENALLGVTAERDELRTHLDEVRAELTVLEARDEALNRELVAAQRARRDATAPARRSRANAAALRRKVP